MTDRNENDLYIVKEPKFPDGVLGGYTVRNCDRKPTASRKGQCTVVAWFDTRAEAKAYTISATLVGEPANPKTGRDTHV